MIPHRFATLCHLICSFQSTYSEGRLHLPQRPSGEAKVCLLPQFMYGRGKLVLGVQWHVLSRRLEEVVVLLTLCTYIREGAVIKVRTHMSRRADRWCRIAAVLNPTVSDMSPTREWVVGLTPSEFCWRTTDPGKWAELLCELSSGVTLSNRLPMNRIGWPVSTWVSARKERDRSASTGYISELSCHVPCGTNRHSGRTVLPTHESRK